MGALTWLIATLASVFAAHLFWMVLRDMMLNLFLAWGPIEVQILSVCLIIATVITLALFRRVLRWLIAGRTVPAAPDPVAGPGRHHRSLAAELECVFAWPTLFALIRFGRCHSHKARFRVGPSLDLASRRSRIRCSRPRSSAT